MVKLCSEYDFRNAWTIHVGKRYLKLDVASILGPNGRIARRLQSYEHRDEQLQMADAVAHALANGKHLIAEAGTGVGKSFAYLVPAILHATEDQQDEPKAKEASEPADDEDCSRRIVVSTHTISLQEQLIEKDLPLLNSVIPREFSSVLVKGRNNYISLRPTRSGSSSGSKSTQ